MTTSATGDKAPDRWQRLSLLSTVTQILPLLGSLATISIAFFLSRSSENTIMLVAIGAIIAFAPLRGLLRFYTFRYRITSDDLEVTSGIFRRNRQIIPRHRIRTVDANASLLYRLLGITVVAIGTGESDGESVRFDAVKASEAKRIEQTLLVKTLDEPAAPVSPAAEQDRVTDATEDAEVYADALPAPADEQPPHALLSFRLGWLKYHILTASSFLAPLIGLGIVYEAISLLNLDEGVLSDAQRWLTHLVAVQPFTWLVIVLVILGIVVLFVISAGLRYITAWHGYTLSLKNEQLHSSRGLLTKRSFTADLTRLRGFTLSTGPVLDAVGGAKLSPIMTGTIENEDSATGEIFPALPTELGFETGRHLLDQNAALATASPKPLPSIATVLAPGWLHSHPRIAIRRRLTRYLAWDLTMLVLFASPYWLWNWPSWFVVVPLVLMVVHIPGAFGYYRRLGHRITDELLIVRVGYFSQHLHVIQLRGISGVALSQSPFQRRYDIANVTVTLAAGDGSYQIPDIHLTNAILVAEAASGQRFRQPL